MNPAVADAPALVRSGTRSYRRINWAFFAAGFVTFVTLYDLQPLLPAFAREYAVAPALASLPLSVATAALAVTMLFAGTLSETIGRKPVMVTALVASSLLALLTAVSEGFAALLALRLLQGAVLAGLPAVAMAYLAEELEPGSIAPAMGLYISGNAIGGMSGRIFTAALADATSWRLALAVVGVVCLLLSGYFLYSLPAARQMQRRPFSSRYLFTSLAGNLRDPGLLGLFGIAFLGMGSFVTLFNYLTFRLLAAPYHLSQSAVSLIFLVYLPGSLSSSLAGRLANRHGRAAVLRGGLALIAGGMLLTLLQPLPWLIVGVALCTVGFFAAHSVASSWVGRRARTARAQASALYLFSYYLGASVCGTVGGYFWSGAGWPGVAGMVGVLLAAGLVLAGWLGRVEKPQPSPNVAQATQTGCST
jgi:MFS transporter, YNFM family, putative membrane transport protein